MSYEDGQRGNGNRKPMGPRYNEPEGNYSPSTNYNYNPGMNSYQSSPHQHHPRRRIDRFRRESLNTTDRLVKQNDIIIRLLKEIRDRLGTPVADMAADAEQDHAVNQEPQQGNNEGLSNTPFDQDEQVEYGEKDEPERS